MGGQRILEQVCASITRFPMMDEECKDAVLSLTPEDALDILNRFDGTTPPVDIYMEARKKLLAKYGANVREGIMAVVKPLVGIDGSAKASLWDLPPDDAMNIVHEFKLHGHTWHSPSSSMFQKAQDVRNRCASQGIFVSPPPRLDESGREIPSP